MKAIPRLTFTSEHGSIEIRSYGIYITGTLEGAALALSKDILDKIPKDAPYNTREIYLNAFVVTKDTGSDSKYVLNLLRQDAINPDTWDALKKAVETICNNLTAFM